MEQQADIIGAICVSVFAGVVLFSYHNIPYVNEALHYYKDHDKRKFVAMRTSYIIISTALAFNARYLLSFAFKKVYKASGKHSWLHATA